MFYIGLTIGVIIGILTMCLVQVNRDNELKKECDYWEREAKKWCAELGEQALCIKGDII